MKVLIVAGGTAGHTIPALRVAEELREKDSSNKILFITTTKKSDKDLIRGKRFEFRSIFSGKFRRYFSLLNFIDPFFVIIGFFQSLYIILRFWPKVIFSKGGYVSLPVIFAGRLLGRKVVIHESDLEMGLANRLGAHCSNKVLVSYPEDLYPKIKRKKLLYTGNPMRRLYFNPKLKDEKTLLIWGGSQGAQRINDAVYDSLDRLLPKYTVIHLTGRLNFDRFNQKKKDLSGKLSEKYKVFAEVFAEDEVARLISQASLAISRAGASSVGELALAAVPLILVPLQGHQENNAAFYEKQNSAVVIKNADFTADRLITEVDAIMSDIEKKNSLSENISELSSPNAAAKVVEVLSSI